MNKLLRALHSASKAHSHYDTLSLPTSASHKQVKESFYELSKAYHPDRHPRDEGAKERFVKVNEAYSVLGNAKRRAAYDQEVVHTAPPRPTRTAGGRPASGLSRRRTRPVGVPPSYKAHQPLYPEDAPHFNQHEHYQRHYDNERRRQGAQRAHEPNAVESDDFWGRFVSVSLVVAAIIYISGGIRVAADEVEYNKHLQLHGRLSIDCEGESDLN